MNLGEFIRGPELPSMVKQSVDTFIERQPTDFELRRRLPSLTSICQELLQKVFDKVAAHDHLAGRQPTEPRHSILEENTEGRLSKKRKIARHAPTPSSFASVRSLTPANNRPFKTPIPHSQSHLASALASAEFSPLATPRTCDTASSVISPTPDRQLLAMPMNMTMGFGNPDIGPAPVNPPLFYENSSTCASCLNSQPCDFHPGAIDDFDFSILDGDVDTSFNMGTPRLDDEKEEE